METRSFHTDNRPFKALPLKLVTFASYVTAHNYHSAILYDWE
jgi:hypothetical protein